MKSIFLNFFRTAIEFKPKKKTKLNIFSRWQSAKLKLQRNHFLFNVNMHFILKPIGILLLLLLNKLQTKTAICHQSNLVVNKLLCFSSLSALFRLLSPEVRNIGLSFEKLIKLVRNIENLTQVHFNINFIDSV